MEATQYGAGVFTLDGAFTPEECTRYIAQTEVASNGGRGYESAKLQTPEGETRVETTRNNDRIIVVDASLVAEIFTRLKPVLPPAYKDDLYLVSLNERFRFYRYRPEQYFKTHGDGSYQRNAHEASELSLLIYLNDDFEGGCTQFSWDKVQPKTGRVLVFPHHLLHQGKEVTSGTKYMLRSDIMYSALRH